MQTAVVVSNISNNPKYVYGIPVRKNSKEILGTAQKIIIAVLEDIQLSIYLDLINAGYRNIQVVSKATYEELMYKNNCY